MKISLKHTAPGLFLLEKDAQITPIQLEENTTFQLEHVEGDEWKLIQYFSENTREVYLRTSHEELARVALRLLFKLDVGQARTIRAVDNEDGVVQKREVSLSV